MSKTKNLTEKTTHYNVALIRVWSAEVWPFLEISILRSCSQLRGLLSAVFLKREHQIYLQKHE